MFNLYIGGGELDIINGQNIELNWVPLRFQDDLTDQYTTDFDLPRNRKNVSLLQASGLLDSNNRFSSRIEPALLSLNGELLNVYLQVSSINDDKISVAIFDKVIPADILNKKLPKFNTDSQSTIYPWKYNSWSKYPSVYKKYNNGLYGKFDNCMFHQSRKINDVLDIVSFSLPNSLPHTDDKLWMLASEKNVCPQNKKQVLEVNFTDGDYGLIRGGQHITNDVEWKWQGGNDTITFNRQCNVKMKVWVSWSQPTLDTQYNKFLIFTFARPSTPTQAEIVQFDTIHHYNGIEYCEYTLAHNYISADTTLRFRVDNSSSFRFISCVVDMEITDYNIIEDDYDIDLTYVYRDPKMRYRDYGDSDEKYMTFNGTSQTYHPYSGSTVYTLYCPDLSFCHLGFWCNIPDISLKELLYGLEWLNQKRLVKDKWLYQWVDVDQKYIIDGAITQFDTTNEAVGQKNYILFNGETESDENTVSSIDNYWLEANKDVYQSPFTYSLKRNGNWAYFQQYTEPKDDEDSGEHSAKFDSLDGLPVAKIEPTTPNLLLRVVLPTLGFEEVTESTTVKIETFDNVKNADYVYLDGRKFMVQSIDTDLNTGISTITAIEIWKQNPASEIHWPPVVEITNIENITDTSALLTFTITEQ